MKRNLSMGLVALAALSFGGSAIAQDQSIKALSPEVVERAPNGRVMSVRVEGKVYQVCQNEQQDSCIQPRAAGLSYGDRPLRHWPDKRR